MSYLNDQNHYLTGTYLGEDAPQEVAMPEQTEQPAPAQIPFLQRTIIIPGLGAITYQTILLIALGLLLVLYYLRRRN